MNNANLAIPDYKKFVGDFEAFLKEIVSICGVNSNDLNEIENRVVLIQMEDLYVDGEFMGKFKTEMITKEDGTYGSHIYFFKADEIN